MSEPHITAEAASSSSERQTKGRFVAGNPGGPGNPFARRTAALRAYLINHVTERDMQDILDVLLLNAKSGHLPSIKFLFSYVLGKPKPVVEPDMLDMQEMHQFQQAALPPELTEALSGQLPLAFLVQLLRFSQAANAVDVVESGQDASENAPQPAEEPMCPEQSVQSAAPPVAPSINGEVGEPQAADGHKRPSTNGEMKRRPKLAGFDWLRDLRRPPGGRPKT
jgi:hypothetical protein